MLFTVLEVDNDDSTPMTIEVLIPTEGFASAFDCNNLFHSIPVEECAPPDIDMDSDSDETVPLMEPYEEIYGSEGTLF